MADRGQSRDDSPIPTPMPQRLADFRRRQLPVVVWLACALLCAFLLHREGIRQEYVGLAQAARYELSAPRTARIDAVFVAALDSVGSGDIVAALVDEELEARLERSRASIRLLQAELVAQRARLSVDSAVDSADRVTGLRRFQTDEEARRLRRLELQASIRADELEVEQLDRRLERSRTLLDSGVMGPVQFEEVRLERDRLAGRIDENRELLARTEDELAAARARREDFERASARPGDEPFLDPFREAITVEAQRLREIEAGIEGLALRSPIDGQVSRVLCREGQTVVSGEPIVTITDRRVRDIVTWLEEDDPRRVEADARVLVSAEGSRTRTIESVVVRVAEHVDLLPERLWRSPETPSYGRAVVIAALPDMGFAPGARLRIRFLR